jgi:ribonuclease T1
VVAAVVSGLLAPAAQAREQAPAAAITVSLAELPVQAQATHRLVLQGGPFPYPKDGISFGNRERQLPRQPKGYYREYTVKTPGSRDRGARRLVCGGSTPPKPEVCYYTDDHYASFRRIAP